MSAQSWTYNGHLHRSKQKKKRKEKKGQIAKLEVLEIFSIFSNSISLKNKLDTQMAHQIGKDKTRCRFL
jgi:hypothetical protein